MSDILLPKFKPDEWKQIVKKVKNEGVHRLSSRTVQVVKQGASKEGGCAKSVRCETVVDLVKKIKKVRGVTELTHIEIDQGTWMGTSGNGGHYIEVFIHIRIKLDLSALGKSSKEENKEVRKARIKANKRYKFKKLPLEFILLHEEMHAQDICKLLSKHASSAIRCGMSAAQIKTLKDKMQALYDAMLVEAHKGKKPVQGALEKDIRERCWAEWDKRHPNYKD